MTDKPGGIATHSKLLSCLTLQLPSNMRLSRGAIPWLWSKCLDVSSWAECCALEKIGVITEEACRLAIGAVVGPCAFEECARPALTAPRQSNGRCRLSVAPLSGIPQGCFHSSGIQQVVLGGMQLSLGIGPMKTANCLPRLTFPALGLPSSICTLSRTVIA